MRSVLLAVLSALVLAATSASAATHSRVKSYCSPSGDVCYGIFRNTSGSVFTFKLTLAAKYFARYQVCVVPLGEKATCHSFPVKKTGAAWGGTVNWSRNFPVRGPRGYRVTWKQGGRRLGPSLTFYVPAPIS